MGNKTSITGFIGTFFTKSDNTNPLTTMDEVGGSLQSGQVYLDLRTSQAQGTGQGGALMWYNATKGAWFGAIGTTSTSTTTTSTTTTTTTSAT